METRAHHILIGAFTLAVVAAALLFIVWLGQIQVSRQYVYYDIAFPEAVTGLNNAADVRYQGIPVGSVSRIWIDPEEPEKVHVTIEIEARDDIRVLDTTVASLEMLGITGVSFVQLTNRSMGGTPLPLVYDPQGDLPEIESELSSLQSLFADTPRLIRTADDLLNDLRDLLNPDNRAVFAGILEDVKTLTGAIAARSAEIDAIIRNVEAFSDDAVGVSEDVSLLAADLRSLSNRLNTLLAEEGAAAIANLGEAAKSFGVLAQDSSRLVRDNEDAINTFTSQGLAQMGHFLAEARQLVANLDRIARRIEQNPSEFLFGGSKPIEVEPVETEN